MPGIFQSNQSIQPYRVEGRSEGCPTCQHGEQFDIVGPGETAQSQSWGDREEADYVCELMNDAYAAGRASYAQHILDTLNTEVTGNAAEQAKTAGEAQAPEAAKAPEASPDATEDDIPF